MNESIEISREWLQTLENKLQSLAGIDRASIIVREVSETQSLDAMPVADLLPNLPPRPQPHQKESDAVVPAKRVAHEEDLTCPPAIAHGGDLKEPEKVPRNLPQILMRAAKLSPHEGIVYIKSDGSKDFQSYTELLEDAMRVLTGLRKLGLRAGDKVIFQFADNREFISTFWGCVLGGIVPVPVGIPLMYSGSNSAINKLVNTSLMLSRPFIATNRRLAKSIGSLPDLAGIPGIQVITIEELLENKPDEIMHESNPADTALMMLTSGSTGTPKGVLLSHKNLLSRSAGSVQKNGFSSRDTTLNWMPLDHVAGIIYFHLRDVFTHSKQIHVISQMILENPLKWIDLLDQYRATVTFAPNFAFGLVNKQEAEIKNRKWDLSSVRFILNGGEAIMPKTARKFLELLIPQGLPNTAMHPAWGMSETSSGVIYSDRFTLESVKDGDSFVEVGEPIPGFSVRIVDDRGTILEESKTGRLQVKGLTVTEGYFNNPQANSGAFTEDGWFDTGDLGVIRDGQLTIAGRGKDEIIINGVNYYPHEIESAVESVEGVEVSFTAACAVRSSNDDTDKLAIFFVASHPDWNHQVELAGKIRARIVREFGIFPSYALPLTKKEIPKTEIGKIQRSQLGTRFAEGAFNVLIKRTETGDGVGDMIPGWFYRKLWIRTKFDGGYAASADGHYLIFMDDLGLGGKLIQFLERTKQKYVQIDMGEQFALQGENRFQISPGAPEHYDQLMTVLTPRNISIRTVVHLWGYSEYQPADCIDMISDAQNRGIYSLLALIRKLSESRNPGEEIRLFVITSHAQAVALKGPLAYEKSTLSGFLKAARLDLPWLQCRHIDLEHTDMDGKLLIDEISSADTEAEIAYRDGIRMKSCLSKIDMLAETPGNLPLKEGGLYLVTGGLGGIGAFLAQRLMSQFRAKLILVGRKNLPDHSLWDTSNQNDGGMAERIRAYKDIESANRGTGGEFVYQAADVSNYKEIEASVSNAESRWGIPLSGIFHLAGDLDIAGHWKTIETRRIDREGWDAFQAMFGAKVYGTWNLFQILKRRPDAIFVGFSSVVSELGAATFGAYCSGNSFLDSCCQYHDRTLPQNVFSFKWSMWEDTGMNKANPQYAQKAASSMGNMIIEPESGWVSLLAGLCRQNRQILVGLNGLNPNICSRLDEQRETRKRFDLYITTPSGGPLTDDLREQVNLVLQDSKYPFEIVKIDAIPILDDGSVDIESLRRYGSDGAMESTTPETDAEKKIAEIWREVLGIKRIRTDINFFELGGTSVQLAQVNGQLKAAFGRDISMTDLFQFPTISSLAGLLTSSTAASLSNSLSESRDRATGRRAKMLIRRKKNQK